MYLPSILAGLVAAPSSRRQQVLGFGCPAVDGVGHRAIRAVQRLKTTVTSTVQFSSLLGQCEITEMDRASFHRLPKHNGRRDQGGARAGRLPSRRSEGWS